MTEQLALYVWLALGAYLALGALTALAVLTFGPSRLEPTAVKMAVRVRLLVAPGLIALWPLVLVRLAGLLLLLVGVSAAALTVKSAVDRAGMDAVAKRGE
jgi:hypothetical protein